MRDGCLEGAAITSRFPLRFRCRRSLLGHPIPAGELGLPCGRLTGHARGRVPDLDGVTAFRTHELRPGWAPSIPRGRRCSSRLRDVPSRRLPHHSGRPCTPPPAIHRRGSLHEASTRVQAIRPSGLPLACGPRMEREPLGFPRASHPTVTSGARRGRGQAIEHGPETTLYDISRTSNQRVHSVRATSRRTVPSDRLRGARDGARNTRNGAARHERDIETGALPPLYECSIRSSGRDGMENELLQHLSDVVERREANSYINATLWFRMLEAALHVRHRPGRGRLISRPEVHADAGAWHARCRLAMSLPAPSGRRREARAPGADRDRRRGGCRR
jgi:hypothetical protein